MADIPSWHTKTIQHIFSTPDIILLLCYALRNSTFFLHQIKFCFFAMLCAIAHFFYTPYWMGYITTTLPFCFVQRNGTFFLHHSMFFIYWGYLHIFSTPLAFLLCPMEQHIFSTPGQIQYFLLCSIDEHIFSTPQYVFSIQGPFAQFFYAFFLFAMFYGIAHFFYTR